MKKNQKSKIVDSVETKGSKIVKTDVGSKDGQEKCPKCGSTDISTNVKNGKLRCNFCRHEFEVQKITNMVENLETLDGDVIGSGATDIDKNIKDVITLKCSSCGAEVVIDTASATQARCHWCRNTLSINEQIPNGAIPDVVLPFSITKDDARSEIEKFVKKRNFFAHPKFKKEFTTENIMGVYFPYMLVDFNGHATLVGEGEIKTRSYTVKEGDHYKTYYDADLYHVERDFDLTINGLSIESNSNRLNNTSKTETNNIINSIMPFDTENCVKFNANYLNGYTSEKRDTNISDLKEIVDIQAKDISRFAANDTLKKYDRGVCWENEEFKIKGHQWKAAYLPVWLYSYLQVKGNKKLLHYVAVNARTKETMGSIPINMLKLTLVSIFIELLAALGMVFVDWEDDFIFLATGIIYFFIIYAKYRNSNARHTYETETKTDMKNLKSIDKYIKARKRLSNSKISGANNTKLEGNNISNAVLDKIANNAKIKTITGKDIVSFKDNDDE